MIMLMLINANFGGKFCNAQSLTPHCYTCSKVGNWHNVQNQGF